MNFQKNCNKMGGWGSGSKAVWIFFWKFIHFGNDSPPLLWKYFMWQSLQLQLPKAGRGRFWVKMNASKMSRINYCATTQHIRSGPKICASNNMLSIPEQQNSWMSSELIKWIGDIGTCGGSHKIVRVCLNLVCNTITIIMIWLPANSNYR